MSHAISPYQLNHCALSVVTMRNESIAQGNYLSIPLIAIVAQAGFAFATLYHFVELVMSGALYISCLADLNTWKSNMFMGMRSVLHSLTFFCSNLFFPKLDTEYLKKDIIFHLSPSLKDFTDLARILNNKNRNINATYNLIKQLNNKYQTADQILIPPYLCHNTTKESFISFLQNLNAKATPADLEFSLSTKPFDLFMGNYHFETGLKSIFDIVR